MEFRLTYSGPLRPSQRDPRDGQKEPLADHKQMLRRKFHPQIKRLWETTPMLHQRWPIYLAGSPPPKMSGVAVDLGAQYERDGWRFYPVVQAGLKLSCWLDILFLRADRPDGVIYAGDIDNRIKTLIDGLRIPQNQNEFGSDGGPHEGEDPFFCLLAEDKLVTKLSIESDALLEPIEARALQPDDVRVVITVRLHPYQANLENLDFV